MKINSSQTAKISLFLPALLVLLMAACGQETLVSSQVAPGDQVATGADVLLAKSGTKMLFEAVQVATGGVPPQSRWTGNVRHDEGARAFGALKGDLVGTVEAIGSGVFVQISEQRAKGTIQLTGTYTLVGLFGERVDGGFEGFGIGQVEITPDGETNTGRFNGHGTGELEGMRMHATWELLDGEFLVEGFIQMP